jgi:hypothetical protein
MSLTSFIQRADVKALLRQHVQMSRVKFPEGPICEPLTTHYGLVGTAFDYLCRFCLQRHYPHAIARRWVAEETLSLLVAPSVFDEEAEAIFDLAQQIVSVAKVQQTRYLKEGLLTEALLSSCLLLAQLDPLYRSGMLYEPFGKIDPLDLRDMQQLGHALIYTGMAQLVSEEVCLLNPIFGASLLVGGADTDLILDHCLIDIKTTKWLKFSREYLDQLIGYYLLYLIGGIPGLQGEYAITHLGIYYSRHAYLYTFPVESAIPTDSLKILLPAFTKLAVALRSSREL